MKKTFLILSTIAFGILFSFFIFLKIRHYDYNLSSLIGIWEGFRDANPLYIPQGFVVLKDGGYDGQFFFLLSRYIYEFDSLGFPILDSFYFRFHRLGLSLLVGLPTHWIGITSYPLFTLLFLSTVHLISFYLLSSVLSLKNKYLSLYFLFSPFSFLGIQLLVSDPLLISLCIISAYLILIVSTKKQPRYPVLILGMLLFSLSLIVRETSLFLIIPILIYAAFNKDYSKVLFLIPAFLVYIGFLVWTQNISVPEPGTLPLKFIDMVDYPLLGFFKSLEFSEGFNWKQLTRDSIKFFHLVLFIQLTLNLWNIVKYAKTDKSQAFQLGLLLFPVACCLGIITIAEQGYWRSFDNMTRMFTITIPPIILAKNYFKGYRDYGFLPSTLVLTLFLFIRSGFISRPMEYFIQSGL